LRLPHRAAGYLEPLTPTAPLNRFAGAFPEDARQLLLFNGWGGFSPDGREYHILLKNGKHLPAPWINVIANLRFGCLVSELGSGYTWWSNSREFKLTPWSNDPVLDPHGEVCYLRDEESGEFWSAMPLTAAGQTYSVTHGRGFTCFYHDRCGIRQEMTVFVPLDDPVKVVRLHLTNATAGQRRLSVTYYAEWVLGVSRQIGASFIISDWDEKAQIMLARNVYQEAFQDAFSFLGVYSQTEAPAEVGGPDSVRADNLSWTADRSEFLGRNGSLKNPAALARERLSGQTGAFYEPCGAVQSKITLEPGAQRTVYILLGCEHSRGKAVQLAQKYRQQGVCDQAFAKVREFWEEGVLGQIKVNTPSPEMDVLINGWLLYQTLGCRVWARTAFYQAGGAYGFRDQLQDTLACRPKRER
jgi:cellobiose phosphorylase